MANEQRKKSLYFDSGDPATYHVNPSFKPGELGEIVNLNNDTWQKVVVDSGATASTPTGIVAQGEVAFWKNKATFTVTNDPRFAWNSGSNPQNAVAGMFQAAAAAGEETAILLRGRGSALAASGGTWTEGNWVIANSGSAADFTTVTAAGPQTYLVCGIVRGARGGTTAGHAAVDFDLPQVP